MSQAALALDHSPLTASIEPIGPRGRCWKGADIDPHDLLVPLGETELADLAVMLESMRAEPLPALLRHPDQFHIPALRARMLAAREQLVDGIGVAVVDRLPLDEMDVEEARAVFWCLGQLIGRTVAQKWDGTMFYDVTDTGRAFGYGVRGSVTNIELVFHTDNAFGKAPPAQVGLMCLHPAVTGGVSRFCSMGAVHDDLLAREPRLVERLYQPMYFDRQAEHAEGAERVVWAPTFARRDGGFTARANTQLVRKGYALLGEPLDPVLDEALTALRETTEDPSFWVESAIERGQLQYLDNNDVAHFRSEFSDHPEPALKRHLVRTWHRNAGRRSYDG